MTRETRSIVTMLFENIRLFYFIVSHHIQLYKLRNGKNKIIVKKAAFTVPVAEFPANKRHSTIDGSMLYQRHRSWTNIEPSS